MKKVVSMGLHICDIHGRPVTSIPEGQSLSILEETKISVAGTAAGTSVDMAKLGLEVYAMGATGDDTMGDLMRDTMQSYNINTLGLIRKTGVQTSTSILLIRPNGERPALHVPGANSLYTIDDVNFPILAKTDFLHFGGTGLLPGIDGEPSRKILEFAKRHSVVTTFDLIAMPNEALLSLIEPCLEFVDYFMPGLEEAEMICGLRNREEIHKFFLNRGAAHTVFKNGSDGSYIGWLDDGQLQEIHIPALQTRVVDSTGCGDSYCAGFIKALSLEKSLPACGKIGSICGALVISGLGSDTGIIDWPQVERIMDDITRIPHN